MRVLGLSLMVALVSVGCGGGLPVAPDAVVTPAETVVLKIAPARTCAVQEVVLTVEPSDLIRLAYRVEASYVMASDDSSCTPPAWSLQGRGGRIAQTSNPYVVHVQSMRRGNVLTVVATAANGRTGSQDLKF